jgi:hypothetical protein
MVMLEFLISGVCSSHVLPSRTYPQEFWYNLGPSSGLSLFSPQGLEWVAARTGTDELQVFITNLARSQALETPSRLVEKWSPIAPGDRTRLPPRHLADKCIKRMLPNISLIRSRANSECRIFFVTELGNSSVRLHQFHAAI